MKESYFPDFLVVLCAVLIIKKLGETSTAKNQRPVSFLYLVSDIYEKLILFFLSKRRLQVVLNVKSSQDYSANAGVSDDASFGPALFQVYINDLPDNFICNIAINADDTALYSKCDWVSDLWHLLQLASCFLISMLEKLNWF